MSISWTLDSSNNPTFTVTPGTTVSPAGFYGVALGVLPSGKISLGYRDQHLVAAQ